MAVSRAIFEGSPSRWWLLGTGVVLVFLALMPGHLYSIDGLNYYRGAIRLFYDGSFIFDHPILWGPTANAAPSGPIGFSLAYLPALLLAAPFGDRLPPISVTPTDLGMLYGDPFYNFVAWTNGLLVALTAVAMGMVARLVGFGPKASVGLAIVAVFATALCFYGRADLPQALMALLVTACTAITLRAHRDGATRMIWLLVPLLAWAVLTRPVDGTLLAIAVGGTLVLATWAASRARQLESLVPPALGYAIGLALSLASNWMKFGRPFDYGYGPGFTGDLLPGLVAWLVSPGRGLLWYAPVALLALFGAVLLARRRDFVRLVALVGPLALYLPVYSVWAGLGGWSWGPRYLVPVLPLVVVLAAIPIANGARTAYRITFAGLALLGALINLGHLAVDPLQQFWGVYGDSVQGTVGFGRQFEVTANGGIGIWQYYHPSSLDSLGDVMWLHLIPSTGGWSLLVFAVLIGGGTTALAVAYWRGPNHRARAPESGAHP